MYKERIKKLVETMKLTAPFSQEHRQTCHDVNDELPAGHLVLLKQLVEEDPMLVADVNECHFNDLIEFDLIVNICMRNHSDYIAATQHGRNVWLAIDRSTGFDG